MDIHAKTLKVCIIIINLNVTFTYCFFFHKSMWMAIGPLFLWSVIVQNYDCLTGLFCNTVYQVVVIIHSWGIHISRWCILSLTWHSIYTLFCTSTTSTFVHLLSCCFSSAVILINWGMHRMLWRVRCTRSLSRPFKICKHKFKIHFDLCSRNPHLLKTNIHNLKI